MNTRINMEYTKLLHMAAVATALINTLDTIPVCPQYEKEAETAAALADLLADMLNASVMEGVA